MTDTVLLDGPALVRGVVRKWWLVVITALLGALVGLAWSLSQPTQYSAEQEIIVSGQVQTPLLVNSQQANVDPQRLVTTQMDLLTSRAVQDAAQGKLGHSVPPLAAGNSSGSNLVTITLTSTSPTAAKSLLSAYLSAYQGVLGQQTNTLYNQAESVLRKRIAGYDGALSVDSIQPNSAVRSTLLSERSNAQQLLDQVQAARQLGPIDTHTAGPVISSGSPVSPLPARSTVLGAILGAALGVLIAAAAHARRLNLSESRRPRSRAFSKLGRRPAAKAGHDQSVRAGDPEPRFVTGPESEREVPAAAGRH